MKSLIICLFLAVLVLCGCANEETNTEIRVAIIDTGISSQAIESEYIAEGQNYLIPDGTTEDTFGHGTAVASVILENSSDVVLVPLVSNVYDSGRVSFVDNTTFAQMIILAFVFEYVLRFLKENRFLFLLRRDLS